MRTEGLRDVTSLFVCLFVCLLQAVQAVNMSHDSANAQMDIKVSNSLTSYVIVVITAAVFTASLEITAKEDSPFHSFPLCYLLTIISVVVVQLCFFLLLLFYSVAVPDRCFVLFRLLFQFRSLICHGLK